MTVMPLAMMSEGEEGTVVHVTAGRGLARRLAEMGIGPGARVRVIRNGPGPMLVSVRGVRMAIGRGIAMKVMVEVRPAGPLASFNYFLTVVDPMYYPLMRYLMLG